MPPSLRYVARASPDRRGNIARGIVNECRSLSLRALDRGPGSATILTKARSAGSVFGLVQPVT
jgi:hypothetical protein